ncbi:hypothetical protein [Agrococcus sp. DT81.2]|uniref:hypothetical protein n=1 Tax=Agrococcus sp. DT81.2 TaxID=3393414 RepID=UPI003CE58EAA
MDDVVGIDEEDDADGAAPTIAGHPLVRALRRDAAREVWVATDASGAGVELHRSLPGEEATLAREAEALLVAEHPHLVPILDVATDAGVVLVRPLLPHDLADWLRERGAPQPGEAVTALAPIAAALGALHAVGAAVGGVTAQQVRLDTDGAPLLVGEGANVETARPSPAWRERSEAVASDVADWAALAEAVLSAGGAELPDSVARALDARDIAAAGEALLAAWPALPLGMQPDAAPVEVARPRLRDRDRAVGLDAVWARAALLLERLSDRMPTLRSGRMPRASAIVRGLRAVRAPFWAVAAASAVAFAVAVAALLPPTAAGEARMPVSPPAAASAVPTASPDTSGPPQAAPAAAPTDDPVTGAAMLLAEREACLDAADAACLVGLHEPDSPQLTADRPWRMPADGRLELVQRLGEAWLLRVVSDDEPASVLVMSSEAGWTLRDAWPD